MDAHLYFLHKQLDKSRIWVDKITFGKKGNGSKNSGLFFILKKNRRNVLTPTIYSIIKLLITRSGMCCSALPDSFLPFIAAVII